jgi:hypothetical protein
VTGIIVQFNFEANLRKGIVEAVENLRDIVRKL